MLEWMFCRRLQYYKQSLFVKEYPLVVAISFSINNISQKAAALAVNGEIPFCTAAIVSSSSSSFLSLRRLILQLLHQQSYILLKVYYAMHHKSISLSFCFGFLECFLKFLRSESQIRIVQKQEQRSTRTDELVIRNTVLILRSIDAAIIFVLIPTHSFRGIFALLNHVHSYACIVLYGNALNVGNKFPFRMPSDVLRCPMLAFMTHNFFCVTSIFFLL